MTEQMFLETLIFVFAVIALISLGAASFIKLVALILENGSKVEAVLKEVQRVQTLSSPATDDSLSSPEQSTTPTMPESPISGSPATSPVTKFRSHL